MENGNFNLNEYKKWDDIILSYRGAINQELIILFLKLAETKIYPAYKSPKFRRKIFSVLIETLQNIKKYAMPDETGFNNAYFLVKRVDDGLQISTGNLVDTESRQKLEVVLDVVDKSNIIKLKELAKTKLFEDRKDDTDSVGIGLFELAIKSEKKMIYKFHKINDTTSFFSIEVNLTHN